MATRSGIFALALVLAAASPMAAAQETGQPPIHSPEVADARLAQVAKERAAVEARFSDGEQLCHARFFVNRCLDKAKEQRRAALAGLRAIEIEASYFKRAWSLAQRDQALAEQQGEEGRGARVPPKAPTVPLKPRAAAAPGNAPGNGAAQRLAEHEAKVNERQAREALDAGKRAANVAAFEEKQRKSAERQREIAAKQAAKALEASKDAAAAK